MEQAEKHEDLDTKTLDERRALDSKLAKAVGQSLSQLQRRNRMASDAAATAG